MLIVHCICTVQCTFNNELYSHHFPSGATTGYRRQGKTCQRHIGTLSGLISVSQYLNLLETKKKFSNFFLDVLASFDLQLEPCEV